MTSASVNSAVLSTDLTATITTTRVRNTSSVQDFGKIISQAKEKVQQTDNSPIKEKKTAEVTKISENTKSTVTDEVKSEVQDNNKDSITEKEDFTSIDSNTPIEDEISEDMLESINEKVKELIESICDELDISQEELEDAIALMGINPVELFDINNIVKLISNFTEDGNMIGIVADEDLYGSLQELIKAVDELTDQLIEETGLTKEELDEVMNQIQVVNNDDKVKTIDDSNIIDFSKVLDEQMPVVSNTTEKVDLQNEVKSSEIDTSFSQIENGTTNTQPEITVVKTDKEDNSSKQNDSQNDSQHDMPGFMNNSNETDNVSTSEVTMMPESDIPNTESILKQIADYVKIQSNSSEDITKMELQLHPASLGSVNVSLTTKGGIVTAQFATENETVKHAIETQTVQLRSQLEEQGVKIDAIEVSVASHQMERNLEQNNQGQHNNENDNKTGKIQKIRRTNINLNLLDEESGVEEAKDEDDATRIAMEIMKANGNTMDLLA